MTISPKFLISIFSPKFSNTSTGKMLFLKIFLSAPKIFRRHKESQKRHSGAKAPQLTTLDYSIFGKRKLYVNNNITMTRNKIQFIHATSIKLQTQSSPLSFLKFILTNDKINMRAIYKINFVVSVFSFQSKQSFS